MKNLITYLIEAKSTGCDAVRDAALDVLRNSKSGWGGNILPRDGDVENLITLARQKLTKTKIPGSCYVVICGDSKQDINGIQFIDLSKRYNGGSGVPKHGVSFYTSKYSVSYALDFMKERSNPNGIDGKMDKYEFYKFDAALIQSLWDAYEKM